MYTFNIFGSCISLDIFRQQAGRSEQEKLSRLTFTARQSIVSSVATPFYVDESKIAGNAPQKTVVLSDLNKLFFDTLKANPSDFLIIDLTEERREACIFGDISKICTYTMELINSGYLEGKEYQVLSKNALIRSYPALIEDSIQAFATRLLTLYPAERIIIHKCFPSDQYTDLEGTLQPFPENRRQINATFRALYRFFYDRLEALLPGCHVIAISERYNANIKNPYNRDPLHCNPDPLHYGEDYRTAVYDLLLDIARESTVSLAERLDLGSQFSPDENESLAAYLQGLCAHRNEKAQRVGAIVMNCNPFTNGHRYLIEYAAARVEQLYIFVVEEDRSVFPFADRLSLVTEGTRDLPNVTVLPSGRFIISSLTFDAYFEKEEKREETIDPTFDIRLFAEKIAPALGITVRFVGEEPLCNITRQYNETMERVLPQYNIDFVMIPRKDFGGAPISASRVRALLKERDFGAIAQIVPPSTLSYLEQTY